MKVLVDADACPRPVLAIVRSHQKQYGYEVTTISSFNHRHPGEDHVTVGNEEQAADIALINLVKPGDLVVTQDWGLAAMALGRQAAAIAPDGRVFRPETIDFLLEERNLKARHRRGGGRTRGPAARNREDDERFTRGFLALVRRDK